MSDAGSKKRPPLGRPPPCRTKTLTWPLACRVGPGLDGAVATETRISCVDGESGTLHYRGIPIEDLAGKITFEEVAGLLIEDIRSDSPRETKRQWRCKLRTSRQIPEPVEALVRSLPPETHPTFLRGRDASRLLHPAGRLPPRSTR